MLARKPQEWTEKSGTLRRRRHGQYMHSSVGVIKLNLFDVFMVAINKADGDNKLSAERACGLYQKAMQLMHPAESPWTPPVLTCSAATNTGIDVLWSQILKHRTRFEATAWFAKRRRDQMVQWMWDLVNEHIQHLLHDRPE